MAILKSNTVINYGICMKDGFGTQFELRHNHKIIMPVVKGNAI
jgi:hypothetical protein